MPSQRRWYASGVNKMSVSLGGLESPLEAARTLVFVKRRPEGWWMIVILAFICLNTDVGLPRYGENFGFDNDNFTLRPSCTCRVGCRSPASPCPRRGAGMAGERDGPWLQSFFRSSQGIPARGRLERAVPRFLLRSES